MGVLVAGTAVSVLWSPPLTVTNSAARNGSSRRLHRSSLSRGRVDGLAAGCDRLIGCRDESSKARTKLDDSRRGGRWRWVRGGCVLSCAGSHIRVKLGSAEAVLMLDSRYGVADMMELRKDIFLDEPHRKLYTTSTARPSYQSDLRHVCHNTRPEVLQRCHPACMYRADRFGKRCGQRPDQMATLSGFIGIVMQAFALPPRSTTSTQRLYQALHCLAAYTKNPARPCILEEEVFHNPRSFLLLARVCHSPGCSPERQKQNSADSELVLALNRVLDGLGRLSTRHSDR
ncbi:hypothetical protein KCU81_g373, partial [Aureobasidium melanogenum]